MRARMHLFEPLELELALTIFLCLYRAHANMYLTMNEYTVAFFPFSGTVSMLSLLRLPSRKIQNMVRIIQIFIRKGNHTTPG